MSPAPVEILVEPPAWCCGHGPRLCAVFPDGRIDTAGIEGYESVVVELDLEPVWGEDISPMALAVTLIGVALNTSSRGGACR